MESCTSRCHDVSEYVPFLAHNFPFGATPLLMHYWLKRWLPIEREGGFIFPMVSLCLGCLWLIVSMDGFYVMTKGNHDVRVIYSFPSSNGGIYFKTSWAFSSNSLSFNAQTNHWLKPQGPHTTFNVQFLMSCGFGLLICIIIYVMQDFILKFIVIKRACTSHQKRSYNGI